MDIPVKRHFYLQSTEADVFLLDFHANIALVSGFQGTLGSAALLLFSSTCTQHYSKPALTLHMINTVAISVTIVNIMLHIYSDSVYACIFLSAKDQI